MKKITLSSNDKITFISNMSTMLTAGIPILETIDSLAEDAKGNLKKILEELRNDIMQGKPINQSFAKFPYAFDKVTVNIIKAAEEAGTLDVALKDIKENIRKEAEFRDKIKSALTYPILIFVVFIGVFLLILTFVVPRISTVFMRMRVELPLPTKILIFLSDLIVKNAIIAIVLAVLSIIAVVVLYVQQKKLLLRILFSLPLISNLVQQIDITRFSRSMYLLLNAGIPITSALELSEEVVMKSEITKSIRHCKELVMSGKKLSEGFKNAKHIFPSIMIKITEAGEKTGSLDKAMQDTSDYLDYQVSNTLKTLTALLEPIMLVVVGVMIGGMMLSIIAPIYGIISQVSGMG